MTDAYATFAARGIHHDPQAVELVRGPRRAACSASSTPRARRRISAEHGRPGHLRARGRRRSRAPAPRRSFGRPVAGKTGTAENYVDAWFCGYVAAARHLRLGRLPEGRDPDELRRGLAPVFGGTLPAEIWHRVHVAGRRESAGRRTSPTPVFTGHTVSSPYSYVPTYTRARPRRRRSRRSRRRARPRRSRRRSPAPAPTPAPPDARAAPAGDDAAGAARAAAADGADDDAVEPRRRRCSAARSSDAVAAHHRRRLARRGHAARRAARRRLGRRAARSRRGPGTASSCSSTARTLLPRMVEDIAARRARTSTSPAGTSRPSLPHGRRRADAARVCSPRPRERVDVRVLAWAGAPLPLFHPGPRRGARDARRARRPARASQMELDATRAADALPPREARHRRRPRRLRRRPRPDDASAGNRLDSSDHPPRDGLGWHDACLRLEGPLVADVAEHFRAALAASRFAAARRPPAPAGALEAQLVRTVPEHVYDGLPRGEFTILESYRARARSRRSGSSISRASSSGRRSSSRSSPAKLREPPRDDFRLVALLPAQPNNGSDDTRGQLGVLADAANDGGDGDRFLACTLYQPRRQARSTCTRRSASSTTRWLTVGSANLNEHSLFNDTEVNVVAPRPAVRPRGAAAASGRSISRPTGDRDPVDPSTPSWRPRAFAADESHRLRLLRGVSRRTPRDPRAPERPRRRRLEGLAEGRSCGTTVLCNPS